MKNILIIIFVSLIFLSGLFYWFQWRPSEIRKNCVTQAKDQAKEKYASTQLSAEDQETFNKLFDKPAPTGQSFLKKDYDVYYEICLTENGLKR